MFTKVTRTISLCVSVNIRATPLSPRRVPERVNAIDQRQEWGR